MSVILKILLTRHNNKGSFFSNDSLMAVQILSGRTYAALLGCDFMKMRLRAAGACPARSQFFRQDLFAEEFHEFAARVGRELLVFVVLS